VGILKAAGSFISMRILREVFVRRRQEDGAITATPGSAAEGLREDGASSSSLSRAGSSHSQQPLGRQTNGVAVNKNFIYVITVQMLKSH